jgi:hypothetical protein
VGPTILNLSTNVTTLTPEEQLVVTAVVTDPQGIAQVVGGTLSDPGGASYGAFQVSTTSGAYSLTLTWAAIETVKDIDSGAGGTSRTFDAVFYDQSGNSTSQEFSIQLECDTTTDGICGGACTDLQTDPANCGVCAHACASLASCKVGECLQNVDSSTVESCGAVCTAAGGTCWCGQHYADCLAGYHNNDSYEISDCTTVPQATYEGGAFATVACTCAM